MRHFLVTGMNSSEKEEIKKFKKSLKLDLTFQPHRCQWCDYIRDIKESRKRKQHEDTL